MRPHQGVSRHVLISNLNPGDVILITQAYVRNWQERAGVKFSGPVKKSQAYNKKSRCRKIVHLKKLAELRDG